MTSETPELTPLQEFVNGLREQGMTDTQIAAELDARAKTEAGQAEQAAAVKAAKSPAARKPSARQRARGAKDTTAPAMVEHDYKGTVVLVKASLTKAEKDAAARAILSPNADQGTDAAAPKPDKPKPARSTQAQVKPKKDGSVRVYLSDKQFAKVTVKGALTPATLKAVKAGERKEQKASDGTIRKVYYSLILTEDQAGMLKVALDA